VAWLWLSAGLMAFTALVHSWLGEKRIVMPLLAYSEGVMRHPLARVIVRYAWHVTSALMVASALTVAWPGTPHTLVTAVGAIWLALGLTSLVASRGKHVGWPVLSGAGLTAIIGAQG
jgi:hypothetical protein